MYTPKSNFRVYTIDVNLIITTILINIGRGILTPPGLAEHFSTDSLLELILANHVGKYFTSEVGCRLHMTQGIYTTPHNLSVIDDLIYAQLSGYMDNFKADELYNITVMLVGTHLHIVVRSSVDGE